MEQESLLNSKGKPWASRKDGFAAARDRQIEAVHEDTTIHEEWKSDIEQAQPRQLRALDRHFSEALKSCLTDHSTPKLCWLTTLCNTLS